MSTQKHPSFGCLTLSTTCSGHFNLFGENKPHDRAVEINIFKANRKFVYGRETFAIENCLKPIVSFNMSHRAFVEAITGVLLTDAYRSSAPVTFKKIGEDHIMPPPPADPAKEVMLELTEELKSKKAHAASKFEKAIQLLEGKGTMSRSDRLDVMDALKSLIDCNTEVTEHMLKLFYERVKPYMVREWMNDEEESDS